MQSLVLPASLLCLDAPAVAVSWLMLFGSCFGIALSPGNVAALFFTVWLIYLVDRLVDSFSLTPGLPRSIRQSFCASNRALFGWLIFGAGVVDAVFVASALDHVVFVRGVIVGVIVTSYLALNWSCSKAWTVIPLKEPMIGSLFAVGMWVALDPQVSAPLAPMTLAAILFAILCCANCVSIAAWERELDRIQHKHSIATQFGFGHRLRKILAGALIAGSIFVSTIDFAAWPVALCLIAGWIALDVLNTVNISRDERVALADLVLLAPAVFVAIRSLL